MTAIGDFCNTIRAWMNWGEEEYSDTLITSMVRMGEERINEDLRIADMVQIDVGLISDGRVTLPAYWLESDFVRIVGGSALQYKSRNDFYGADENGDYHNAGKYTTVGRFLMVGGDVDSGISVEISYFHEVPPLGDDPTWLLQKYSALYVLATVVHAAAYAIEDPRIPMWETGVTNKIARLNEAYIMSRASGSRLNAKSKRTFG